MHGGIVIIKVFLWVTSKTDSWWDCDHQSKTDSWWDYDHQSFSMDDNVKLIHGGILIMK